MKKSLRSFGLAFFMIGAFFAIVHYFQISIPFISLTEENQSSKEYEQQITKLETELKEANKQIQQLENRVATNHNTENKPTETTKDNPKGNEGIVHGTLQIYSGITPYVVGQKLEDLGIVQNGMEIEMYLARPEYARYIQIGEFELHSGMSIEEIAKIITGKGEKEE